jgi:hypothetical protein
MVPGTDTWLPWIHALVLYRDAFCDCIGQIYRYSRFIDPELSSLLDAIEFSAFSTAVRMLKDLVPEAGKTKYGNPTLEVYAGMYFECYTHARALASYCDRYMSLYVARP